MSTSFFQFYSLTATVSTKNLVSMRSLRSLRKKKFSDHRTIIAILWKPLSNDRWDRKKFYLNDRCRCDRYDRWKVVSLWSLQSLNFFFSAIAAIVRHRCLCYSMLSFCLEHGWSWYVMAHDHSLTWLSMLFHVCLAFCLQHGWANMINHVKLLFAAPWPFQY